MTNPTTDPTTPDRAEQALRTYGDSPLSDGDAVLLLDDSVCLELEQLADDWDDTVRRQLATMLCSSVRRVLLAIARDGEQLHAGDYRIWRELHEELRGSAVDLLPLRALPAA